MQVSHVFSMLAILTMHGITCHVHHMAPAAVVSLRPLQVIAATFREVGAGRAPDATLRRRAVRNVRAGGAICLPMLLRSLCSEDDRLAHWAYFLLTRLGGGRVVHELHGLLRDEQVPDRPKAMAL